MKTDIKIIYEDDFICVIDKPYGIVVNNSNSTGVETVQNWFQSRMVKPEICESNQEFILKGGVVHRLDKDTSGVMILAKTYEAYEGLKLQFLNRQVEKKYLVLVHGKFKDKEGLLSTPIERNPNKKTKFFVGTDLAKTGITTWKVIAETDKYSYLEVRILTGRTHQIRVHMKHLGHPVVSDPIYGFSKSWREDLKICNRLFLHATQLIVLHPISKTKMIFDAELPWILKNLYEQIFV